MKLYTEEEAKELSRDIAEKFACNNMSDETLDDYFKYYENSKMSIIDAEGQEILKQWENDSLSKNIELFHVSHCEMKYDEWCDEENALAWLLTHQIVFLNNVDLSKEYPEYYKEETLTTCVYVNCGDTFAYACADSECLSSSDGDLNSEIYSLYKMCIENYKYGSIKWCSIKRNLKPIKPHVEGMKEQGFWDKDMETLRDNKW